MLKPITRTEKIKTAEIKISEILDRINQAIKDAQRVREECKNRG